jgi:hypothetical protein
MRRACKAKTKTRAARTHPTQTSVIAIGGQLRGSFGGARNLAKASITPTALSDVVIICFANEVTTLFEFLISLTANARFSLSRFVRVLDFTISVMQRSQSDTADRNPADMQKSLCDPRRFVGRCTAVRSYPLVVLQGLKCRPRQSRAHAHAAPRQRSSKSPFF